MNPLEELRNEITRAQSNALAAGLSPVMIIGLLEIFKCDIYGMMHAAAKAQADKQIIPFNRLPPNGLK